MSLFLSSEGMILAHTLPLSNIQLDLEHDSSRDYKKTGLFPGPKTPSVEADVFGNASSTASQENELQSNLQISTAFCIKTNRESSQRLQMMRPLSVKLWDLYRFMMI